MDSWVAFEADRRGDVAPPSQIRNIVPVNSWLLSPTLPLFFPSKPLRIGNTRATWLRASMTIDVLHWSPKHRTIQAKHTNAPAALHASVPTPFELF